MPTGRSGPRLPLMGRAEASALERGQGSGFEGALSPHLDLDQGFQQGGGHMGTGACMYTAARVYTPARVRLGVGWPRRNRHTHASRLPPVPLCSAQRGGRWHEWRERRCWLRATWLLLSFSPSFPGPVGLLPSLPLLRASLFSHHPALFWLVPFISLPTLPCPPLLPLLDLCPCRLGLSGPCSPGSRLSCLLGPAPPQGWCQPAPAFLWVWVGMGGGQRGAWGSGCPSR